MKELLISQYVLEIMDTGYEKLTDWGRLTSSERDLMRRDNIANFLIYRAGDDNTFV